ncbi:DEAD/DEAH box helicase family protein [Gammaproteobacteria bacterium]|nr:DEAD/DEAH box helicase family protein [Gammaproteobacteria bacterium]
MKTPQQIIYDSRDWKALEKKLSKMDSGQRGKVFEWFCVFYLQVESRHATTYKEVLHSDQFLKQTKIKKILGFSKNKEEGVDAIGKRHDGKIDIIQCKYLDRTDKNLTKTHIESPLDIANGKTAKPYVDTILMCSNAKGLTKNEDLRKRHPNIQFRTLLYGDFKHLTKDDFDMIRAVIDGAIPKHEPKNPRSYQEATKNKIIEHFKTESRGQIIHACGTGKTLTSYFTYRELKPKITLFAVPSLQLLNQSLLEWTRESLADNDPISPFAVCSDKSNEKLGECVPELWLQEMGIRVSNKKEDLDIFLKSKRKNKVIFATYQSGEVLAKNIRALKKQIDLAFFDEAHNTATGKGKLSSHLLYNKNIPIKKRLFMTATPKVFKGDSDKEIASMDSEELYGTRIDEITVKDAIDGIDGFKLLNDYQIITHTIKSSLYEHLLEENPFVIDKEQLPKQAELRLLASAILLKKVRKDKNIKNIVSFHSFRNRARAFEKGAKFIDNELNTYYVDGTQSGTERLNILDDFTSNSPSLVTNAQCLSEGVNVPSIDAILFVDPKQSRIAITQAIGRALRKGDSNKGMSYIIVPTIVDTNDPDNSDKRYENILMVLTAMAHHDGRVIEYFTDIQNGKKPPKQFLEIDTEYLNEEINLKEFAKQLNYKAWNRLKRLSWRPFEEAKEYVTSISATETEWRKLKKSGDAPADIPFNPQKVYKEFTSWYDFSGRTSPDDNLNTFIKEYKAYLKNNPSKPFPKQRYVTKDGYKLGRKISEYQNQATQEVKSIIEDAFPNIDFWIGINKFNFLTRYKAFKNYIELNDKIPGKSDKHNKVAVGNFYREIRKRHMHGGIRYGVRKLSKWEYSLINKLDINLDKIDRDKVWMGTYNKYKVLLDQKKEISKKKNSSMYRWMHRQKGNKNLSNTKVELLKSLNPTFFMSDSEASIYKNVNLVLSYAREKKDFNPKIYQNIPFKNKDNDDKTKNIGQILYSLRKLNEVGELEVDFFNQLESAGINMQPKIKASNTYYD